MKRNIITSTVTKNKKYTFWRVLKIVVFCLVLGVGIWNVWKPLPDGINKAWGERSVNSSLVQFIQDTTYKNEKGKKNVDQHIFDEVANMIRNADSYILVDMFLWNDYMGEATTTHRRLAQELSSLLIAKKKENPNIVIEVISDPINISYDGGTSAIFETMKQSGINVTFTNLVMLRDSNPMFSSFWRVFVQPINILHFYFFESNYTFRVFPNIINAGGEKVTMRSFLTLLNFKANHRKLIVVDIEKNGKKDFESLVMSANPHDGSSYHSNVALKVTGNFARDVVSSEMQVLALSNKYPTPPFTDTEIQEQGDVSVELVTDYAIKKKVLSLIKSTKKGDSIDLLMFYISDRDVIRELIAAGERDVIVRLILDPNKDAFGREKNGIPNRETADSLMKGGKENISVRWCDTQGEQCHGKMLLVKQGDVHSIVLGSANYTRRNIGGYNLETNVSVSGNYPYQAWSDADTYFSKLWKNEGLFFTTDYFVYKDESVYKKIISWLMENTGLGTF